MRALDSVSIITDWGAVILTVDQSNVMDREALDIGEPKDTGAIFILYFMSAS
jgi:hypothetical protein